MHKVMIVDDERIIREGIRQLIEWDQLGMEIIGVYENGVQAYDAIVRDMPDIVITDNKMPDMDGLQLIELLHDQYPDIRFIMLTGYDDFEYVQRAIKYGVKDYILKPCDENEITESLLRVKKDLMSKESKEHLLMQMQANWEKALPQVRERFLIEVIESNPYHRHDYDRLREMMHITGDCHRLVMLRPLQDMNILERFALKNIADELLGAFEVVISAVYKGDILLLITSHELDAVKQVTKEIADIFHSYYHKSISIAISDEGEFASLYSLYLDVRKCMEYSFYLGEGSVITSSIIDEDAVPSSEIWRGYESIGQAVRTGNAEAAASLVNQFFDVLAHQKLRIEIAKIYCLELLLTIIRQSQPEEMNDYLPSISKLQQLPTLQSVQQEILAIAGQITSANYERTTRRYSMVVESVISCIHQELANPDLSLKWIAKEVLFMNENYLSRLFQRETGERFSQYLMRVRMETAKQLIESNPADKLYEISEKAGFGDNYHYFSLAFKKYTGLTPSEYKKLNEPSTGSC